MRNFILNIGRNGRLRTVAAWLGVVASAYHLVSAWDHGRMAYVLYYWVLLIVFLVVAILRPWES
jgi:hypothetical protein